MCAWNENPVKAILGMQYQPTRDVLLLRQDWGLDGDPLPPHGRGLLGLIETVGFSLSPSSSSSGF